MDAKKMPNTVFWAKAISAAFLAIIITSALIYLFNVI